MPLKAWWVFGMSRRRSGLRAGTWLLLNRSPLLLPPKKCVRSNLWGQAARAATSARRRPQKNIDYECFWDVFLLIRFSFKSQKSSSFLLRLAGAPTTRNHVKWWWWWWWWWKGACPTRSCNILCSLACSCHLSLLSLLLCFPTRPPRFFRVFCSRCSEPCGYVISLFALKYSIWSNWEEKGESEEKKKKDTVHKMQTERTTVTSIHLFQGECEQWGASSASESHGLP